MKASAFRYVRPATLASALAFLADDAEAVPLGGGQSLLAMLNLRVTSPSLLVDLGALDELRGIAVEDGALRVGASSRHREVMESPLVRAHAPLLAAALEHVAHPAVRNRGTIGGSLALADPAAEMPACVTALQADIVLAGPDGRRSVAAEAFFTGLMQTALLPGELIAEIRIPLAERRWAFRELARRHGDYALAGLAATPGRFVYFGCSDHAHTAIAVAALSLRGSLRHDDPALLDALRIDLGDHDTPGLRGDTRLRLAAALTCDVMADLRA
jgi:carbon-monoxide dehydrogenase medium subunit